MDLFTAFCGKYLECFTYKGKVPRKIGIEKEILATDGEGFMADLPVKVWPHFLKMGLKPFMDTYYKDQIIGFYVGKHQITTDAGKGTFEVIMAPYDNVQKIEVNLKKVLALLHEACEKEGIKAVSLGYQPRTKPSHLHWNRKQRYEVILDYFKKGVHSASLSASDQAHIDVSADEMIRVVNVMNGLAGFMVALFANSPLKHGKRNSMKAYRELIWDALTKVRTGIPQNPFASVEDYLRKMWNLKCIVAIKGNKFFAPNVKFKDYVRRYSLDEAFKAFTLHEGTIWYCARPRVYGTVEIRPASLQPWEDMVSLAAFSVGAVENYREIEIFLKDFSWKSLRALRYNAAAKGFDCHIKGKPLVRFLKEILPLTEKGLRMRKFGEEPYLSALYKRIHEKKTPSDTYYSHFVKGGIKGLLQKTSLRREHLND